MKIIDFLRRAYLVPVRLYQRYISPLKTTPTCRFRPTCSEYAIGAVLEWGIIVGTVLAVIRVIRCNPFSRGGLDPVPSRADFFRKIRALFSRRAERDDKPTRETNEDQEM